jgi:hypothetical protein
LAYSKKFILKFGGRELGEFTRGELIDIHAVLDSHLKIGAAEAAAWRQMSPADRTRVAAVIDAVGEYFCSEAGVILNGRSRHIAAGLMGEFAPTASDDGIAGALRIKPVQVAASRRWLQSVGQDERLGRALAMVRGWIREKLKQPTATRQASIGG